MKDKHEATTRGRSLTQPESSSALLILLFLLMTPSKPRKVPEAITQKGIINASFSMKALCELQRAVAPSVIIILEHLDVLIILSILHS